MKPVILFSLALLTIACLAQDGAQKPNHQDCFLVAPFAKDVRYAAWQGQDQLSYTVQESYPATNVLAFISEKLRQKGWKPLPQDLWNPGMSSSHIRGWEAFDDAASIPEQRVYQWMAQWQDESGNIVSYTLQYKYPTSDAKLEPEFHMNGLHVFAIYIPEKRVREIRAEQQNASALQRN